MSLKYEPSSEPLQVPYFASTELLEAAVEQSNWVARASKRAAAAREVLPPFSLWFKRGSTAGGTPPFPSGSRSRSTGWREPASAPPPQGRYYPFSGGTPPFCGRYYPFVAAAAREVLPLFPPVHLPQNGRYYLPK